MNARSSWRRRLRHLAQRLHRRLLILHWSGHLGPLLVGIGLALCIVVVDVAGGGVSWFVVTGDAWAFGISGYAGCRFWGFRRLERAVDHLLSGTRLQRHEKAIPHSVLIDLDAERIRDWLAEGDRRRGV